jgi:diguanylate cyclase (GGDEF)-like protein/PAS domain S-box-containing protein
MMFDIKTLAFISCLTFLTQSIALFVQYIVNRAHRGVIWWLLGTALWAIGVIFMPMVSIESLKILAMVANPLAILGLVFLYIGIVRFLDQRENRWVLGSIFVGFIVSYYYFMFAQNNISGRTIIGTATTSVISFMSAWKLFITKDKHILVSARYNAIVFFLYGCFSTIRFFVTLLSPVVQTYSEMGGMLALSFIFPIVVNLLWTFGFIIMVNQRLNGEIHEEKENLQLIFNTSPDAALISRLSDGMIVDVNSGYLVMSGYNREELINNSTLKTNVWHKIGDREIFINELKDKGFCENLEFVFQRKDRSLLTGRISAKIISIQSIPHIVSVVQDITKSNQAAEALRESEELYRSILNASPDDITITDLQGHILVISPAAKKIFGYEPEYDKFVGTQLVDYIIPEDRERAKINILRMFKGDSTGPNDYHAVRKDGSIFDIEVNSGLIHGAKGQPAKMVFVVRNITERKQAEQQIQQLVQQLEIEKKAAQLNANTDSLTGLANRRYFDEVLSKEFLRLKRSGSPLSLIMLDVDHFKKFNDTYGHLAGDDCLKQIGTTLETLVGRVTDVAARFGGEEFVAILAETDEYGALTLAERIRKAVEALAIPHSGSDIGKYVTVSLGVVTVHPTRLASPDQVVALADEALYCAKKDGRNRTSVTTERAILDYSNFERLFQRFTG